MNSREEALPLLVREILAIFEHELADVSFGDLDASQLLALAERVRVADERVDSVRAELDQARDAQRAALADLVALSEKALAYARIYAESAPELAPRLEALAPVPPPKRRGRRAAAKKSKKEPEVTELSFEQIAS